MSDRIEQINDFEMRISDDRRLDSVMLPVVVCLVVAIFYAIFAAVGSDELPAGVAILLALLVSVGLIFQQAKQGVMKYEIILDKKHGKYRIAATRNFFSQHKYMGELSRFKADIKTIEFTDGDDEDDYTCGVFFRASGEEFYLSIGNIEDAEVELARINVFLS